MQDEFGWDRVRAGFFLNISEVSFFDGGEEKAKICPECERAHELLDKGDSAGSFMHCCGADPKCECVCRSWRRIG
jgi:hypothetical protein